MLYCVRARACVCVRVCGAVRVRVCARVCVCVGGGYLTVLYGFKILKTGISQKNSVPDSGENCRNFWKKSEALHFFSCSQSHILIDPITPCSRSSLLSRKLPLCTAVRTQLDHFPTGAALSNVMGFPGFPCCHRKRNPLILRRT